MARPELNYQLDVFSKWYINNGPVYTAKRIKEMRLAVTRHLAGDPLRTSDLVALNKSGLPKCLSRTFKKLVLSKDPRSISLVLTILSLSRGILGGSPVDTQAITKPTTFVMEKSIDLEVIEFMKALDIPEAEVPEASKFH